MVAFDSLEDLFWKELHRKSRAESITWFVACPVDSHFFNCQGTLPKRLASVPQETKLSKKCNSPRMSTSWYKYTYKWYDILNVKIQLLSWIFWVKDMLVSSFNLLDSKAFKLTNGAYAATRMNSIGDLGCYGSWRCSNWHIEFPYEFTWGCLKKAEMWLL